MIAAAFVTPSGVTVPAVTADQMRRVDRVAMEETGPNLYQMMENAGRNLATHVIERLGAQWDRVPVVVVTGVGGNGGGGICAARHLANHGADVTVVVADDARLAEVSAAQLHIFRSTPGRSVHPGAIGSLEAALVIDAVIGYSLRGAPRGVIAEMIEWMGDQPAAVVSLDVPSGVDATTGVAPGSHVRAASTVTLALPKTGLGVASVGELWLTDIGIPVEVYRRVGVDIPARMFGSSDRVRLSWAGHARDSESSSVPGGLIG